MSFSLCSVAVVTSPLFANPWLVLFAVVAGIAAGLFAWALVARRPAAAPPPSAPSAPVASAMPVALPASPSRVEIPPAEILAIIAAVVRATLGAGAKIADVVQVKSAAMAVDTHMQHWSMEGRRQIYSSHQIR